MDFRLDDGGRIVRRLPESCADERSVLGSHHGSAAGNRDAAAGSAVLRCTGRGFDHAAAHGADQQSPAVVPRPIGPTNFAPCAGRFQRAVFQFFAKCFAGYADRCSAELFARRVRCAAGDAGFVAAQTLVRSTGRICLSPSVCSAGRFRPGRGSSRSSQATGCRSHCRRNANSNTRDQRRCSSKPLGAGRKFRRSRAIRYAVGHRACAEQQRFDSHCRADCFEQHFESIAGQRTGTGTRTASTGRCDEFANVCSASGDADSGCFTGDHSG